MIFMTLKGDLFRYILKHYKKKLNKLLLFSKWKQLESGKSSPQQSLIIPTQLPLSLSLTLTLCITKDPESDSKMKRMEGRMKGKWHVHQISGSYPSVLDGKIVSIHFIDQQSSLLVKIMVKIQ